ncbi:MAG: hypothetical protein U0V18_11135 [Anaerolineales bacterium]
MEGYEGLSRTWMEQLTLLSSIIGGFSLAIAVEFLAGEKKQRIASILIGIFILTASLLLIATSVGSQIVVKMAILENVQIADAPPHLLENMPIAAAFVSAFYYVGLGLFIVGLGLAGWMHSKALGIATTIMAVVGGGTVVTLMLMIR